MKNQITKINVIRVFKESNRKLREKLIRLEGDFSLSSLMNAIGWKFVILSLGSVRKATSRIRLYHKFATYLLVMNKRHGAEFTVKYLKACNLAISKFLAGEPFKSLREIEPDLPLPRLSKSGLPAIIGTRDRRSLHSNSHRIVRLWLTLFSLYRIIRIPAKAKLNTITDPFTGNSKFLEIAGNWMEFKGPTVLQRFLDKVELKKQEKFSIGESASPTNSKSWTGMLTDISLLKTSHAFFLSFVRIMEFTCEPKLVKIFNDLSKIVPSIHSNNFDLLPMKDSFRNLLDFKNRSPLIGLGQLQQKEEAAGKMRTFAMVDSWTQTILMPLHTYLSDILRNIKNDGTADHGKAFDRVMARSVEFGCSYGYDLSAATDRLPISIQVKLLSGLLGRDFANDWAKLLVGRPYSLIKTDKNNNILSCEDFWYKVGQPMGARSSFTMLGLTHHMILQYCSHILGNHSSWEDRYEIVGDDIIIFNKDLADQYLKVMNLIGVPINVSKSVVSVRKPVAEFVKRVCLNGKDVSPFSWKQFISGNSFLGRINTTIALFKKDISLSEKAISVFHTVLKEKTYDTRPVRDSMALISLWMTYAIKSNMKFQDMMRALFLNFPKLESRSLVFTKFDFHKLGKKVKNMIQTGNAPVDASYHPDFILMCDILKVRYLNKVWNMRKTHSMVPIRSFKEKIINCIAGFSLSTSKGSELDILLYSVLQEWINKVQDPMTEKDKTGKIVWAYHWLDNNLMQPWCLTNHHLNPYNLGTAYDLYMKCQGKLAFYELPNRLNMPLVEQVSKDVVDNSILRDMINVLEEVEKLKRPKANIRISRVDSSL